MFTRNDKLSREENIKLAEESASKASQLLDAIETAVKEGFKHVPKYGTTPTQNKKLASVTEVIARLQSEKSIAYRLKSDYSTMDRIAAEKQKLEEAQKEKATKEAERVKLVGEAIQYLIQNGKIINEHFTIENAISKANDLAFELVVDKLNQDNTPIDFSGDDNCEDCAGWIPGSHRCDCGNRRVGWVMGWGHSFKQPSVYAEAY